MVMSLVPFFNVSAADYSPEVFWFQFPEIWQLYEDAGYRLTVFEVYIDRSYFPAFIVNVFFNLVISHFVGIRQKYSAVIWNDKKNNIWENAFAEEISEGKGFLQKQ